MSLELDGNIVDRIEGYLLAKSGNAKRGLPPGDADTGGSEKVARTLCFGEPGAPPAPRGLPPSFAMTEEVQAFLRAGPPSAAKPAVPMAKPAEPATASSSADVVMEDAPMATSPYKMPESVRDVVKTQDADVIEAEERAKDLEEAVLRLRPTPSSSYVGTPKASPDFSLPEPGTVIEGDIRLPEAALPQPVTPRRVPFKAMPTPKAVPSPSKAKELLPAAAWIAAMESTSD
jgi:hypothetical protein